MERIRAIRKPTTPGIRIPVVAAVANHPVGKGSKSQRQLPLKLLIGAHTKA
jgi:hypothetical protein